MSDRSRLIFMGNVIVDLVMTVTAMPETGGDTIASSSQITAGGGFNVMVTAQRDGLDVVFAGQYGTGPFGDVVRAALDSSGVEVLQPGLVEEESGYCLVLVDQSTERTFVTSVGAEGHPSRPRPNPGYRRRHRVRVGLQPRPPGQSGRATRLVGRAA